MLTATFLFAYDNRKRRPTRVLLIIMVDLDPGESQMS
jgi:hypothetical protein